MEASAHASKNQPQQYSLRRRQRQQDEDNCNTGKNAKRPIVQDATTAVKNPKRPTVQIRPATSLSQHGASAVLPGLSSLPDETLLLIFNKLSIGDLVRCGTVCRSWRSLVRSSSCWARSPLKLSVEYEMWNLKKSAFKKTFTIVDAIQHQFACGLTHASELDISFTARHPLWVDHVSVISPTDESQMNRIVQSLFHRLTTSSRPPLTIECLKLADVNPTPGLCEALAPHCQHVKTLHFSYSFSVSFMKNLPSLSHVLDACPSVDEIHLGCSSAWDFHGQGHQILTPLREIAAFAQRRSRPFRCVREQRSQGFDLNLSEGHLTHVRPRLPELLPYLGSFHFKVVSDLESSGLFSVPVPGIRCHVDVPDDPSDFAGSPSQHSDFFQALSHHLRRCQASYHALIKDRHSTSGPCAALKNFLSTPSVRELDEFSPTDYLHRGVYPNIRRFVHHFISLEDLWTLSVACPNLSCLSVFVSTSNAGRSTADDYDAFPSFPSLMHLWLGTSNSALASHMASTSPSLTHVSLNCRKGRDTFLKAVLRLPLLTTLTINLGDNSQQDDASWVHEECTETEAGMPLTLSPNSPVCPAVGGRLKHLHLTILSAAGSRTDHQLLCTLLSRSSSTLETLYLYISSSVWVHLAVDALLAGRFAHLRWADISVPLKVITKLRARHPLCLWYTVRL